MKFITNKGIINLFVIAAVIKGKKVLLIHRKIPDVWELPGGNIEYGENPSETAKREVKEETGLDVKVKTILEIGSTIRPDKVHEIVLAYLCKSKSKIVTIDEEHTEYRWVNFNEIRKIKNLATSVQSVLKSLKKYIE
jgi:8-oxo-dGTP diphosphatase